MLARFLTEEDGATAIEYALIAALIAVTIVASVRAFGEATSTMYDELDKTVQSATGN